MLSYFIHLVGELGQIGSCFHCIFNLYYRVFGAFIYNEFYCCLPLTLISVS